MEESTLKQEMYIIPNATRERDKRIIELAMNLAKAYPISLEEAMYHIENVLTSFRDVVKEIKEIWDKLVQSVKQLSCSVMDDIEYQEKHKWLMVWDTRRKSQVLLNKPKYLIRKVIL